MDLTTDVLGEDRELARPLDEGRRALVRREGIAAVLELPSGTHGTRARPPTTRAGLRPAHPRRAARAPRRASLPVTHETLANLVAARRPSVSAALSSLAERGVVRRDGEGVVLLGEPPADRDAA
jgi:CRP-like cAMP-binding protein